MVWMLMLIRIVIRWPFIWHHHQVKLLNPLFNDQITATLDYQCHKYNVQRWLAMVNMLMR